MSNTVRTATIEDHPRLVGAIQEWWGDSRTLQEARELSLLLPRLFLQHFSATSLVMEDGGGVSAFLVGFYSPDRPGEAYIHFVGVDPARRRDGVARQLYERFFSEARRAGRHRVRAVTSPQNQGSVFFHRAMGFEVEPAPDGGDVFEDYDGTDQHRICFVRDL